jgi:hypothetical protein
MDTVCVKRKTHYAWCGVAQDSPVPNFVSYSPNALILGEKVCQGQGIQTRYSSGLKAEV